MAPIQQPNFRPFARSGFRVCLFETPIKSVSSGQVSHSIAYALPAMAAVSASGFVAGARLARDAFRARRRAPEAPKVRFPRAQSADTSRRRGTDAVSPTTSVKRVFNRDVPLRRRRTRATRVFRRVRLTSNAIHSISSLTRPNAPRFPVRARRLFPAPSSRARPADSARPQRRKPPRARSRLGPTRTSNPSPRSRGRRAPRRPPPPRPTAPRWPRSTPRRRRRERPPSARSASCTTRARA